MQRARIFLGIGVWIAILPYLGLPYAWKDILFTLTGLLLAYLGYKMYKDHKRLEAPERNFDNFRENSPLHSAEL